LHRLDALASNGWLEEYEFVKRRRGELSEERLRPPRLISGDDLMAEGYRPGPLFTEILAAVEDAQLEGGIATRDEALELVRARYPIG
jgi:poly(A) polymerase